MIIRTASFLKSVKNASDYPRTGLPEIALCGRSNAGKSSLINYLTGNNGLAKTSSAPGKTRLVNFFLINGQFLLVDLPGYGYAGVSKSEKNSWARMVEGYFGASETLRALLLLIDIRREPNEYDADMLNWAAHFGYSVIVAATKADKVPKTARPQRIAQIKASLSGIEYPVVAVSSLKKFGRDELLAEIEKVLP